MIKTFCDGCGKEITGQNAPRGGPLHDNDRLGATLITVGGALHVEVITSKDGTANNGDWCKYCILDALNRLDDRPKAL